jgi:hypothetical protein
VIQHLEVTIQSRLAIADLVNQAQYVVLPPPDALRELQTLLEYAGEAKPEIKPATLYP